MSAYMGRDEATQAFTFETHRLRIRPLTESDEDLFCELYGDPETMRFIGPTIPRERAARSFKRVLELNAARPLRDLILALTLKADSAGAGICSIQSIDVQQRCAELGIIVSARHRSCGLSVEGLGSLAARAFAALPVDEVWVQIASDHVVAERLVLSVGFSPSRTGRHEDAQPGRSVWSIYRDSQPHFKITTE